MTPRSKRRSGMKISRQFIFWAIFGAAVFFLLGMVAGQKVAPASLELAVHGADTYPEPYRPVIYYRLDMKPLRIVVEYACTNERNPPDWITWESLDAEFKEYLPRHTWWIDDPQGAR
jgi:hypothetical protein